ncbi:hypothetical protein C0J52_14931 [Blattella germanica]|nr:hypothetical protein C0J52_14931 [Blattella germanica]
MLDIFVSSSEGAFLLFNKRILCERNFARSCKKSEEWSIPKPRQEEKKDKRSKLNFWIGEALNYRVVCSDPSPLLGSMGGGFHAFPNAFRLFFIVHSATTR